MENQNSVCYITRISEIKEIPGADNIEQAVIGGWFAIVKKNEYNVHDLVIIATTDAVIPQELSDGLGITNYLRKGNRVRTVKLRGVYSECLIIPIEFIPDKNRYEGADCMELLNISKYEPPVVQIQLSSGCKISYKSNPNFSVYYKFPNIKNVKEMFTEEDRIEISRKIHGTNARYGVVKKTKLSLWDRFRRFIGDDTAEYEFVVGSHNVEKGSDSQGYYDTNVWYDIAKRYGIKNKIWNYINEFGIDRIGSGVIIYGEIYGPGIQKNYDYGLKEIQFVGFDVQVNGVYKGTSRSWFILNQIMELPYIEILYSGKWSQEVQDKYTLNNFIEGTKIPHEGIVIKHVSGDRHKVAKVINPDYLIYGEKHDVGDSH